MLQFQPMITVLLYSWIAFHSFKQSNQIKLWLCNFSREINIFAQRSVLHSRSWFSVENLSNIKVFVETLNLLFGFFCPLETFSARRQYCYNSTEGVNKTKGTLLSSLSYIKGNKGNRLFVPIPTPDQLQQRNPTARNSTRVSKENEMSEWYWRCGKF